MSCTHIQGALAHPYKPMLGLPGMQQATFDALNSEGESEALTGLANGLCRANPKLPSHGGVLSAVSMWPFSFHTPTDSRKRTHQEHEAMGLNCNDTRRLLRAFPMPNLHIRHTIQVRTTRSIPKAKKQLLAQFKGRSMIPKSTVYSPFIQSQ